MMITVSITGRKHLQAIHRAIELGVDVRGFLPWSICGCTQHQ